jgi:glycine/D-amino acid oxidase-like deaminating enzyme
LVAVDIIIVGGGLAGCALAWQCRARGLRALLIDQPRDDSASRVAAGLVTPITGSRFATSWRWQEFFPAADTLYRRVEQDTGHSFWSVAPAWRVFTSHEEADRYQRRWVNSISPEDSTEIATEPLSDASLPPHLRGNGGFHMSPAGRLQVPVYLDATRSVLEQEGLLVSIDLDVERELQPLPTEVAIPSLGLTARWVVLCQGYRARSNPWFSSLPLHPARGDILRVRSQGLELDHVLHHHGWIVPEGEDRYLLGASYDRHALDTSSDHPAASHWRNALSRQWTEMTGEILHEGTASVLEHRIAVRPASYDRHPLIGSHPQSHRVWCLNGLGSKGSLMAPWLASHLLDAMVENSPIDRALHWARRVAPP